ncbi:hypothetical protein PIB30_101139 [Stylosanthes scabra]|uniref:Uncharacterized protein n=1 Tax=Stylosanthes scabra TaxID=79078 RepID=A0ABU6WVJ7_9FABA|nr:hypothetical protein [Stylosanthes scabra]
MASFCSNEILNLLRPHPPIPKCCCTLTTPLQNLSSVAESPPPATLFISLAAVALPLHHREPSPSPSASPRFFPPPSSSFRHCHVASTVAQQPQLQAYPSFHRRRASLLYFRRRLACDWYASLLYIDFFSDCWFL